MNKEEIDEAVANGKYIANIYGEGSIGYYKVYSMIDVISKLQKENEDMREELQMYVDTDIMKLQEENKELKEQRDNAIKLRKELIEEKTMTCISKAKIKEALGNKDIPDGMILFYIETLVSENNRLEDIEDRKVQIEYNNVFNKGVKSVKDKIRTKIEELEEKCEAIKKTYTGTYALNGNYLEAFSQIVILRELLGDDE